MKVRLTGDLSGTRNDKPWPARGAEMELPEEEAVQLCSMGMAVPVVEDKTEKAVAKDVSEKRGKPAARKR